VGAAALPDDEALRALAREVLERSEYVRWRALDTDVARHVLDLLARFLDWMTTLSQTAPLFYAALLGVLVLVASLLLAHVVLSLRRALAAPTEAEQEKAHVPAPRFTDQVETLARDGHFLEAARRLQLASIETLLGRGQLELRRFEANRTLRRRIEESGLPAAERGEFVRLLQRLERRFFRDREDDRELYEAWRALHGRLVAGAASR
jgi:hypothetical protein